MHVLLLEPQLPLVEKKGWKRNIIVLHNAIMKQWKMNILGFSFLVVVPTVACVIRQVFVAWSLLEQLI
jgi:hypothetical protein